MKDVTLIKPADLLRRYRIATFDAAAESRAYVATLGTITCKRGCSNCCHQKVLSTAAEGMMIFLYLFEEKRWNAPLVKALEEADAHALATSHSVWFEQRKPCPLLRGNACSVYPVRPPSCWGTFSIGGNPDLCAGNGAPGTGQLQVNGMTEKLSKLIALLAAVEAGLPDTGYMTLPGAILYAAAFVENRPLPKTLIIPFNRDEAGTLIEKFDAAGKAFSNGDT